MQCDKTKSIQCWPREGYRSIECFQSEALAEIAYISQLDISALTMWQPGGNNNYSHVFWEACLIFAPHSLFSILASVLFCQNLWYCTFFSVKSEFYRILEPWFVSVAISTYVPETLKSSPKVPKGYRHTSRSGYGYRSRSQNSYDDEEVRCRERW